MRLSHGLFGNQEKSNVGLGLAQFNMMKGGVKGTLLRRKRSPSQSILAVSDGLGGKKTGFATKVLFANASQILAYPE